MFFSDLQQKKIQEILSLFSRRIQQIRQKRLTTLNHFEEEKKNKKIKIILDRVDKI